MPADPLTDLEALIPQPRLVATTLGDIAVRPLVTAELPPFLRAARPVFDALEAAGNMDGVDWISLVEQHGERIIDALAIATRQEPARIGTLPLDHTVALLQAVLEENMDFFVRRLLPGAVRLMSGLLAHISPASGPTPSSASSETGIAATTS